MKNTIDFFRSHIRKMPAYEPILPLDVLSEELGIPVESLVKLDANENPYGPIPEVNQALANLDTLHIYPDPECRRIRRIMAAYHWIKEESIIFGAGADELIDLIMRVFLNPGDSLLNCPPTFGMYAFDGKLNQVNVISIPRKQDFSLNMDDIKKAIAEHKPKLLFLANPNNPDGGLLQESVLNELLQLPLILVVDEAYINFCDQDRSMLNMVRSYPNLIVLRTFSKWAGLAGVRIGYGVFPLNFVPIIMKAKQPYNISVTAEKAVEVTMQHVFRLEENKIRIIEERKRLYSKLEEIPWLHPYPSQANFILCRVEEISAREVKERLREKGILIRYFEKPGVTDHIRISIGKKNQVDALIEALERMV